MTLLCTNYQACKDFQGSFSRGQYECTGCGGDLKPFKRITNLIDQIIDELCGKVDVNTPEVVGASMIDGVKRIIVLQAEAGIECSPTEAALLLQVRSLQRINDCKEELDKIVRRRR